MHGTKVRALACIGLAALVTCGVVMMSLASSWGHNDSSSKPRVDGPPSKTSSKKKNTPSSAKKESAPTVIVSGTTTPAPTLVIGGSEKAADAAPAIGEVLSATSKSEGTTPVAAANLDVKGAGHDGATRTSDSLAAIEKKETPPEKKDTEALNGVLPAPVEKADALKNEEAAKQAKNEAATVAIGGPAKDDKSIKLASGTEPAPPLVGTPTVGGSPEVVPDLKPVKPSVVEGSKPNAGAIDKVPSAEATPATALDPVKTPSAALPPEKTSAEEAKPAKPLTADEELEKSRTEEKRLAEDLAKKQAQLKELEGRHQDARGRLIKALASKVEAVTKEMESLQKELSDRRKTLEGLTPAPTPAADKKIEDRIGAVSVPEPKTADVKPKAPVVEKKPEVPTADNKYEDRIAPAPEKKVEDRIAPRPASTGSDAKEPPQTIEPAQGKTAPPTAAGSAKIKSEPKDKQGTELPPVY